MRAGRAVHRGLGEAAVHDHPAAQAGGEVRGAEPEQLAVRVDVVVVARGVRLRRAEPLGEADERDARRARRQVEVAAASTSGRPSGGSPASIEPTMSTPWLSSESSSTATTPSATATSEPGTAGANRRRPAPRRARARRRRASRALSRRGCPGRSQACSKKSPSPFSTPRSFGSWPTMMVSARPTMKPFRTGSEMKPARKPSRSSPAASARMPGGHGERRGRRAKPCWPARRAPRPSPPTARRWPTSGPRRGGASCPVRRRAAARPGPRRADDRRDAGDRGVGERLRDQHRPHGEAGDGVAAQPRAVDPRSDAKSSGIRASLDARGVASSPAWVAAPRQARAARALRARYRPAPVGDVDLR